MCSTNRASVRREKRKQKIREGKTRETIKKIWEKEGGREDEYMECGGLLGHIML